jgi:hypothetical protein
VPQSTMYPKEHDLGVLTAYCGEGGSNAGFFSLYDRPPAPGHSLPGLVCPYRQVGLCTVVRETYPLLAFLFSDALEEIRILNVDLPLSQFHNPLVLESPESKGYGHPSGSYDGSQLLVGVGVGYD